jgi:deoxycytidylate deaminase
MKLHAPGSYGGTTIPDKHMRSLLYKAGALSLNSKVRKGRHCAMVLDNSGLPLSSFVNRHTAAMDATIHAEAGAIMNLPAGATGCTLIVVRRNYRGDVLLSKPCTACHQAIVDSGIEKCIYSMGDGDYKLMIFQ